MYSKYTIPVPWASKDFDSKNKPCKISGADVPPEVSDLFLKVLLIDNSCEREKFK